ncbi:E3 ubiquitin-protein ligase upl7 [Ancistrocladus abbreviatus]
MDEPKKHQVSLRGASAKEITRDALLEKVSYERELRNFTRRATAATLCIQRIWRRYYVTKRMALQLREEWGLFMTNGSDLNKTMISCNVLRPFLFFITHLFTARHKIQTQHIRCMHRCFMILLESMNSTDVDKNFSSLAIGTVEERRMWTYQVQKLISFCSLILAEYDSSSRSNDIAALTSLALRLVITLSDLKGWKCISDEGHQDAGRAVKDVIRFIGSSESGLYRAVGIYINKLDAPLPSEIRSSIHTDDRFLITASAITLTLRPFQVVKLDMEDSISLNMQAAAELYCIFILPIPWLVQRTPALLLPALRHRSVLVPCFRTLLISSEKILMEYLVMDQSGISCRVSMMPHVGWALSNVIGMATESANDSVGLGRFVDAVDCVAYVHVLNNLAENLLAGIENFGCMRKESHESQDDVGSSAESSCTFIHGADMTLGSLCFIDLLSPLCSQWHLSRLLTTIKRYSSESEDEALLGNSVLKPLRPLKLLDIARLYSNMIRIYSALNFTGGSLPILNMLSFTPGFLVNIWTGLESCVFPGQAQASQEGVCHADAISGNQNIGVAERKQKQQGKDGRGKWASMLHRVTGKPQADASHVETVSRQLQHTMGNEDTSDVWDVKSMRSGPQSISRDTSCLLHVFCATYAHLLLVLDDIEFYERQVPFSLEQQRRIVSMLNTLVYNGSFHKISQQNRPSMDAAVRCLQMLYERDCRHQFCPPALWLAPARKSRPPIATAARTHEVLSVRPDDSLTITNMGSFITITPYVYSFEERVQMFREFIRMDKASRKMAGELTGPNERAIEIVVRRDHIIEDGFQQLNVLGSRLKSSIHVSFVSECGLPEAGLDYGGLSKEFLTDIAKSAFAPEYGLFTQTSTSERLLIPNTAARFQESGIQMIEFLGRIVGKALYEGILLDYPFSHVFVQKLLGRYSFLDELSMLDPELYKNLMYVKHYDGDVKDLSLDFTVTEESFGKRHIIELKPGGKDMIVTNENRLRYIHAMADYKLNRQMLPLSNAFRRGLTDLISTSWLRLFNASEFNQLLSGGNHDIDIDDLRNNTRYTGGYSEGSRTVKLFWEVMISFEPKQRCMLLKFVTSCSRAPLLGFKHLHPTFTIHKVACDVPLWATIGGQDVERLPSASTCYNTLKLPTYKRASTLRAKLLYAINSNAGFELS